MNGIIDSEREQYPITVCIKFSEGSEYNQPLEMDSDGAQDFMNWFRDKKSSDVWTWKVPSSQAIHMMHRSHIISVDIYGYIEPDGRESRWYERIIDKVRVITGRW